MTRIKLAVVVSTMFLLSFSFTVTEVAVSAVHDTAESVVANATLDNGCCITSLT
jgi:hypothetical protein